jgi:hypothetical protein
MTTSLRPVLFGTILQLLFTGTSAFAQVPSSRDAVAAELMAALDNSVWIQDGKPSDRQIYVIAGPCCGYSQRLYQETRQLTGSVQFRWVMMAAGGPNCTNYVADSALPDTSGALVRMYETLKPARPAPLALRDNAVRWNDTVQSIAIKLLDLSYPGNGNRIDYPTVVWQGKEGIHIARRPAGMGPILASVVARPEATAVIPASRELVNAAFQTEPIARAFYYAKSDGIAIRAFPDQRAPVAVRLQINHGFPGTRRATFHGVNWIEVSLNSDGSAYFVREADVFTQK